MAHFPTLVKIIASFIYWTRQEDVKKSRARFIVFTGSSGKTTTRYFIDYTLKQLGYNSISPQAGYTNEIGIVLASLGISDVSLKKISTWKAIFYNLIPKDSFVCIELGADFRTDIPWFLKRFKANVVVLTDSDQRHWFGGRHNIEKDRQALFETLTPQDAFILSSDRFDELPDAAKLKPQIFKINPQEKFTKKIEIFDLFKDYQVSIPYPKKEYLFQFSRRLFDPQISALGLTLGVVDYLRRLPDLKEDFFMDYVFPEERLEIKRLGLTSTIIADTYKAIPNCTEWFLKNADQIQASKKILVLSEMKPDVINVNLYYGEILNLLPNFSKVYFVGSDKVFNILKKTSTPIEKINLENNYDDLCQKILGEADEGCVVFLKGAQSFGFNNIVRKLSSSGNR